ncbi:ABC transporter substrate-binding protein [Bradyrhizobium sp.]|jgi:branched-chain amino acid transport system substrate-binding protein|uniref:ABC transporter substrate-binding protein n=1 Tax=Bradyrhizobium sp. TaxID=376 RepID=UPI001DBC879D|nr:ABC transporter substrate-binding protein [Bradyrhizobium sp.]MBI5317916.1 ABC transporter substrate-binding protein [Bradyrhizobium sp.]
MFRWFASFFLTFSIAIHPALSAEEPGISSSEIKIGSTFAFSGPASPQGNVGRAIIAYIDALNERGGINGRKIKFIALDDSYNPAKAIEHTRRLVESDQVAFMFSQLGTISNSATAKYLTAKKVPGLFIVSGAAKFTNTDEYPYTTTGLPSSFKEGKIYARYIAETLPTAKIAILYQSDDLGKDFLVAFKDYLKADYANRVISASYDITDPTIDSQVITLRSSGADVLLFAGSPRFAAQTIRKVNELGWKPLVIINSVSNSVSATLTPAGLDKSAGVVTASLFKDPNDPKWKDDVGVKDYVAFLAKHLPSADPADAPYMLGMQQARLLEQVLKQCGDDLSRANIVKQARNLRNLTLPLVLPGIQVNTGPDNNQAITLLQLQRWTGTSWERIGGVVGGSDR